MSVVISDAWRQRFGGTSRLYGEKALQLFADAHICVVGIGGVGSDVYKRQLQQQCVQTLYQPVMGVKRQ